MLCSNLFRFLSLLVPSLFHYSLCSMECPAVITTELNKSAPVSYTQPKQAPRKPLSLPTSQNQFPQPIPTSTKQQTDTERRVRRPATTGKDSYLWIGSLERGSSMCLGPFDSISMRLARLVVILPVSSTRHEERELRYGSWIWPFRRMWSGHLIWWWSGYKCRGA
jgi:hypothetical protein